jgi:hypothetical protein
MQLPLDFKGLKTASAAVFCGICVFLEGKLSFPLRGVHSFWTTLCIISRLDHAHTRRVEDWVKGGGSRLHTATHSVGWALITNTAEDEVGREITALRTCRAVINVLIFGNTSTAHPTTPSVVTSHVMTPHLSDIYTYIQSIYEGT